jgi:hypothetical protein
LTSILPEFSGKTGFTVITGGGDPSATTVIGNPVSINAKHMNIAIFFFIFSFPPIIADIGTPYYD